jgi:hypothetical protein
MSCSEHPPYDRIRIDLFPGTERIADEIVSNTLTIARDAGHHVYERYDRTSSQWSIEITAHERYERVVITDAVLLGVLQAVASQRGISVDEVLREVADSR